MRTILSCLFAFGCICLTASAQTPDACRAAVRHLTLPPTAEFPEMHRKLPLSPIKYLYSGDGIDFYSAIFRFTNYNPPVSAPYDIGMVLVYQDEATRQQIISASRGAVAIRKSDGT